MAVDRVKELVQEGLRRKLSGDLTGAAVAWSEALALDPANTRAREGLEALLASGVAAPAAPPKRNPFARPDTAAVTTTPSPFAGLPANSTPLSLVIPPAASTKAPPPVPTPPSTMQFGVGSTPPAGLPAPPSAGTMVFGVGGTPPTGLPVPPSSGTMVFGLGGTPPPGVPVPPSSGTMVFGLGGTPPPGMPAPPSGTMVFGLDAAPGAPSGPLPGAAAHSPGPSQTIVFGLTPGAPPPAAPTAAGAAAEVIPLPPSPPVVALPAGAELVPLPAPAQTIVYGQDAVRGAGGVADAALESMDLGALASAPPPSPTEAREADFDFPVEAPESSGASDLPFDVDEEPEPAPTAAEPLAPSAAAAPVEEEPDPGRLLLKATDLLDLDDYSGAMAAVEKVLGLNPGNATALELKARCEATLLAMYESKLGDLTRRPALRLKPDEIVWLNLDHRAGFLLSMIDGQVSYDDLFALSSMNRLETARILAQLVQDKVVG